MSDPKYSTRRLQEGRQPVKMTPVRDERTTNAPDPKPVPVPQKTSSSQTPEK